LHFRRARDPLGDFPALADRHRSHSRNRTRSRVRSASGRTLSGPRQVPWREIDADAQALPARI
jgi:hypothetical protein